MKSTVLRLWRGPARYFLSQGVTYRRPKVLLGSFLSLVILGVAVQSTILYRPDRLAQQVSQETFNESVHAENITETISEPVPASLLGQTLSQWLKTNKGTGYGVVVQELGATGRGMTQNAEKPFFTASIYKLFVAYLALEKIDAGELNPSEVLVKEWTVEKCIEEMIVSSDSVCAESYMKKAGRKELTALMKQKGYKSTSVITFETTAADTALLLERLHNEEILSAKSRTFLLSAMKKQKYRSTLVAGSPSIPVAAKPGIHDEGWHDGGIVYDKSGSYLVVVLTDKSTSKQVASFAKLVNEQLSLH